MDKPRKSGTRNRIIRRTFYLVTLGMIGILITVGLTRLKPAPPTVDRATVWVDKVQRGSMLRQVRGLGTLIPEDIRWIPAVTEGSVERVVVRPGASVLASSVLIELSNPELEQSAMDTEFQLKAAQAEYQNLSVKLESQMLDQKASAARVRSEYNQAKLRADADEELSKQGLVSEINKTLSRTTAEELSYRSQIEQQRLAIASKSDQAQLDVQQTRIEQLREQLKLKRNQVKSLKVQAGVDGVVQQVAVEVGQRVVSGAVLAKIANPAHLKAQVKIAETQAKDIQVGQTAQIDTRNGIISGLVARVDPAVQQGTVTVDVNLVGVLPKGVRPDLTVDGTIELERLENTLFVGRPSFSQDHGTVGLFKIESDGKTAVKTKVRLGRSSVNTIEILEGLQEGDQVILSDMSAWDSVDRITLK